MNKKKEIKVPVALRRLEAKFVEWRKHKCGRKRIPEELWEQAEHIARLRGVNLVSKVLDLSYSDLKRRISKGVCKSGSKQSSESIFVEVEGVKPEREPTCVIELEKENGIRLRISMNDPASVDWGRIKEAFLGA